MNARHSNKEGSYFDVVLKYMNQVLMEDDFLENGCIIDDSTLLSAAEKSFYDALNNDDPSFPTHSPQNQDITSSSSSSSSRSDNRSFASIRKTSPEAEQNVSNQQNNGCGLVQLPRGRRKTMQRDRSDLEDTRSTKHFEVDTDESVLHDMFHRILSLSDDTKDPSPDEQKCNVEKSYIKRGPTRREAIDMRSLLIKCTHFVADNDHGNAYNLLKQIRLRSSPIGDGSQRLAHYFANGLEARLVGAQGMENKGVALKSLSDIQVLRSFRIFLYAFPFMESSYQYAANTIMDISQTSTSIHIIHFGIVYGLQWIPLIHRLSTRSGGPPKLRITGIDFPQPGFRPDKRVKETGRRLANYCERFNVPFQYNGIAKKWENVDVGDLKIRKGELLVVNCFYQLMYLPDEIVIEDSPRDAVLKLIHSIKPDVFIHGVSNGAHNSPFFVSRFREALFHFSALFDMMEAIVPCEDPMRMVFEREIWGNEILNTVACEGIERIERPETYKLWQVRTLRAGFRKLPLKQELFNEVRDKVKSSYHRDFFVDEASNWLVEGWKGRIIFAFSCWKPV